VNEYIETACPHCGAYVRLREPFPGAIYPCPICRQLFRARPVRTAEIPPAVTPDRSSDTAGTGTSGTSQAVTEGQQTSGGQQAMPPHSRPAQVVSQPSASAESTVPPDSAALPAATAEEDPFLMIRRKLRRRRMVRKAIPPVLLLLLAAAALVAWLFWDQLYPRVDAWIRAMMSGASSKHQSDNVYQALEEVHIGPMPKREDSGPAVEHDPEEEKDPELKRLRQRLRRAQRQKTGGKPVRPVEPARALLIGVRQYLYLGHLNRGYRAADGDQADPLGLRSLRELLSQHFGFAPDQIAELSDTSQPVHPPTRELIRQALHDFLRSSRPEDRVLVFFSGHLVEKDEKLYLVPLEGNLEDPATLVPVEEVIHALRTCPAYDKLLVLDVAHRDPELGSDLPDPGPLPARAAKLAQEPVPGVRIWLSCSAGQFSHEFASSGIVGSVFTHFLTVIGSEKAAAAAPEISALADEVHKEVEAYVKKRIGADQRPLLSQAWSGQKPPAPKSKPAPIALPKIAGPEWADPEEVRRLLDEIALPVPMPPIRAKALEPYAPDYSSAEERERKTLEMPLRAATVRVARFLHDKHPPFRQDFTYDGDESNFKKLILQEQEVPALYYGELSAKLEELDRVGTMRDQEPSRRWQAHYDTVMALLLARMIWVQEYNFHLGQMRVKLPPLQPPHNGWILQPQEKLLQKETRTLEKRRRELLEKIVRDYPDTPWAIYARSALLTKMGLTLQQARLGF